jgi:tetratricopeptide (TPR) repeat protein
MDSAPLLDRYQLLAELGRGGTGIVYRAHDSLLKRDVAVKVLGGASLTSEAQSRLLDEARSAASINHPGIVGIYDAALSGGTAFVVMELVEGPSLHDLSFPDWVDAARVGREICAALDHAHRNSIVHRDLKPENILFTPEGRVKLVDFGLARPIASRLTAEGSLVGSLHYIAPEQALGQPVDARTDLYSLGVILYELVAGRLPFTAQDPLALVAQHIYAPVVPPRAFRNDLPAAFNDLIVQLLAKLAADRPASAEDVERRLAAIATLQAVEPGEGLVSQLERIARGRMVGRQAELGTAAALWRQAAAGRGQVLLVSGEPGVGKTRLVREVIAQAQISGGRVLQSEAHPEGGAPYAPILRLVRQAVADTVGLPLTSETLVELATLAPELRARFPSLPANALLEPVAERERLCESVVALCTALAASAPLLVFIDDLHWADSGTLYVLRRLARVAARQRMLLVLTYREIELEESGSLDELLYDLTREHLATRLKLARLTGAETRQMLETLFGGAVADELADGIFQETEGNPFFVEEVCRALVQDARVSQQAGLWQAQVAIQDLRIPQSVRLAIQTRVARLPEDAQDALRMAAVLGREFPFDILQASVDLDDERLVDILELAAKAQLIGEERSPSQAERGRPSSPNFVFEHALIPATLRDGASRLRLQRMHRRAAAAYESFRPEDLESIGFHAAAAGDDDKARTCYLRAAEHAQQMGALDDAMRFYEASLEAWSADDRRGRAETLTRLGTCRWLAADPGARQTFEEARDLYATLGDRLRSGDLERMIGRLYWESGDRQTALLHYREGLHILEQEPASPELARAVGSMCQMYMLASEYDDCLAWGERALALAAEHGADDVRVHALNSLGTVYVMLGTPERGLAMLQESLDTALALGLPHDAARGYLNLAECLITVARYREALEQLEAMIAYTSRMYVRGFTWTAAIRLAEVHWLVGEWQAALRILSEQVEAGDLRGGMAGLWARTLRGRMWIDVGLVAPARDLLRDELPNIMASGEIQTIGPHLGQLARAYAALGDQAGLQATTESLRMAIDQNPYLERDSVPALLAACRARVDLPSSSASEAPETWLSRLERAEQQLRSPETHASLHEAVGLLALASGSPGHALEPLRTAVGTWESIDRAFDATRARVDYATALEAAGHPEEAAHAYDQSSTALALLARGLPEGEMRQAFDRSRLVLQAQPARSDGAVGKRPGDARTPPNA